MNVIVVDMCINVCCVCKCWLFKIKFMLLEGVEMYCMVMGFLVVSVFFDFEFLFVVVQVFEQCIYVEWWSDVVIIVVLRIDVVNVDLSIVINFVFDVGEEVDGVGLVIQEVVVFELLFVDGQSFLQFFEQGGGSFSRFQMLVVVVWRLEGIYVGIL